ncbi:hypothetical protein [Flavobacterium sp.]|uniref:hypothetical protein n=1 Tax=Flavobacterium sp. TaxID=239 RepID=UPI0025BB56B4|nr:hypothetical protein [Flavobacterium sp.]MBA4276018.1 hypothetical protein [Flavobacterium sp.]
MNYIKVIILLFFLTGYSQTNVDSIFTFSKYENIDYEKKGDRIRGILNQDKDALIINLDDSKYICLKNNKINCYTICKDTIMNIIKLDSIDAMKCKKLIDTLVSIDPTKITNEIDKEGNRTVVQDGGEFEVSVYKGNKNLKLYSYSPDVYMEDKFPFAENRKTFLYTYLDLEKYFYDKEFERVKSLDTIYLLIKKGKNVQYIVDINKLKNIRQENYFFNFNCSSGQFINLNRFSSIEPTNAFYRKKSFLKTNSNKILHSDYLQKFTQCDLNQLINSNMKKVFIIDKDEIRDGKIKIKEFRGGTYCF